MTFLNGEGAFTNDSKKILYVVVDRLELADVRTAIRETDPEAFVIVQRVSEISGSNFKTPVHQ